MNQQSPTEKNGTTAESTGVTAVLDSMIRSTDRKERATEPPRAETPRPAKAAAQNVVSVDVREPTPAPAPAPAAPERKSIGGLPAAPTRVDFSKYANLGRPMWSVAGATALGLPPRFLEKLDNLKDGDEAAWISALVKLVDPMCTGAPDEPTVIVSSGASDLANALALPVHRRGQLPPYGGSIACEIAQTDEDLAWLDRVRGDRRIHLVLNGEDTDWITFATPSVVSYTSNRGGLEAIKLAEASGAAIAFGVNAEGMPIRATALELALSVRSLFRTR